MRKQALLCVLLPLFMGGCGHAYVRTEMTSVNQPVTAVPSRAGTILNSDGRGSVETPVEGWRGMATSYARRGRGPMRIEGTPADVRSAMRLLAQGGVGRENMMGITRGVPAAGRNRLVVSWPAYEVRLPECGDFTSDQEEFIPDFYHRMSSNLGCSQQRNLGMMISDPGDLVAPRGTQPDSIADTTRGIGRVLDYGTYERPAALPTTGSTQSGR